MPADTFTHTVAVEAAPEEINTVLQDPDTWKDIGPIDDVWDATHDGDVLTGFSWSTRTAGRTWRGTAHRAPAAATVVKLDLDSPEIAGSITVDLGVTEVGTLMTVTLDARSKGVLAGVFWSVVADALRRGLVRQVEAFAERF